MTEKGFIIVISAPSGAGKTTICRQLANKLRKLKYSISCTTRPRRAGERNGVDYYFATESEFAKTAKKGGFAEWALVHGFHYGTPKKPLERLLDSGYDVIMDIDVQGGLKIKKAYPGAVMIFVMTPTFRELEKRLRARKKDDDETIARRLRNARVELKCLPRYEYMVINDKLITAENEVETIITSEHKRIKRNKTPKFE